MSRVVSYPAPQILTVKGPTRGRREDHKRGTLWTDREVAFLLENYRVLGPKRCAAELRRSDLSVRLKAHRMGLAHMPVMTMADIVSRFSVSSMTGLAAS